MEALQLILKERLWSYIVENNPEVMFRLQDEYGVQKFLDTKMETVQALIAELKEDKIPELEIEECCLLVLTREFKPSKYQYVKSLLKVEFSDAYQQLDKTDELAYAVLKMTEECEQLFRDYEFSAETIHDRYLRYAIIAGVHGYLTVNKIGA